jgi:hypothetical protein
LEERVAWFHVHGKIMSDHPVEEIVESMWS